MFIGNWKKEIFTIPNLLSLLRLALVPVYVSIYLGADRPEAYLVAGGILALSCFTDFLDGRIARRYHLESTLGKILDPMADKITQFALIVCLRVKYPVLQPVYVLFVIKELFQLIVGFLFLQRGKILPGALPQGKFCTTVLFVSLIALVLLPDLPAVIVQTIAIADSGFLMLSFVSYLFAYCGRNALVQDLKQE